MPWDRGRIEDLPPEVIDLARARVVPVFVRDGRRISYAEGTCRRPNPLYGEPVLGDHLLDLILLALVVLFAVSGYRQGFIVGSLSCVGFVGGVIVGMLVAPPIVKAVVGRPGTAGAARPS